MSETVEKLVDAALQKLHSAADTSPVPEHVVTALRDECRRRFILANPGAATLPPTCDTSISTASLLQQLDGFADSTHVDDVQKTDITTILKTLEALARTDLVLPELQSCDAFHAATRRLPVRRLQEEGYLSSSAGHYPEVFFTLLLSSSHRALWRTPEPVALEQRLKVAQYLREQLSKVDTAAARKLSMALYRVGAENEPTCDEIKILFKETMLSIPCAFQETEHLIRKLSAQCSSTVVDPAVVTGDDEEPDADCPIGILLSRARGSAPEQLDPTRPTVILPSAKRRIDFVTPIPLQRPPAPQHQRPPQPQPRAEALMALTTRSTTDTHVQQYTGMYSCTSKYHAFYSTPEKHGSRECPYCTICHMMEFLFNGCRRDCCWKHSPTARKISVHLAGCGAAFVKLAKERLMSLQQRLHLDPMDIPI